MNNWPHQDYSLEKLAEAIQNGHRDILLTMPTGSGKTRVMFQHIAAANGNANIYTDRKMLLSQIGEGLETYGIPFGFRAAEHDLDLSADVQLCMVQTETNRVLKGNRRIHPADTVMIDEAHKNSGASMQDLMAEHKSIRPDCVKIGLTATPLGLSHFYEHLIVGAKNSELRKCGALVPAYHFAPNEPDSRWVGKITLDEGECGLATNVRMEYVHRVFGSIVEHYDILNPDGEPTILFAPGVKESIWIAEELNHNGISAVHIDGDKVWIGGQLLPRTRELEEEIFEGSRSGQVKVISNRFVMREGLDCLDSETEVLTTEGWKGPGEVQEGDTLFTLNPKKEQMEVDIVTRAMDREVLPGEQMFVMESQHHNIRVTEGHKFWIQLYDKKSETKRTGRWKVVTARELSKRKTEFHLPLTSVPSENVFWSKCPLSDDEIRFVAWAVTDGYINTGIEIGQSKPYWKDIKELLERMKLDFRHYQQESISNLTNKPRNRHRFAIPLGRRDGLRGCDYLMPYIGKEGCRLWETMDRRQFWVFWNELMKGDGQITTGTRKRLAALSVNNKPLADQLQSMAAARGFASSLHSYTTPKGHVMYGLRLRDKQWICTRPGDRRAARMRLEPPSPGEKVWCLTTKNGTLVTRRKGKVTILGNCPWLKHGIFATVFGSLTSYLQAGGRLLRAHPGKTHCVIQDHGGNWHRHGSLNSDRVWDLHLTDRIVQGVRADRIRERKDPEPIVCPKCFATRISGSKCWSCGFEYVAKSRMVLQKNGSLREMRGDIYRKRRELPEDAKIAKQWASRVKAIKKSKKPTVQNMTFSQLEVAFARDHNWRYAPRTLPLMPLRESDWFMPVRAVEALREEPGAYSHTEMREEEMRQKEEPQQDTKEVQHELFS